MPFLFYLELGVGRMTPMFIFRYTFLAVDLSSLIISINSRDVFLSATLEGKREAIYEGIVETFREAVELKKIYYDKPISDTMRNLQKITDLKSSFILTTNGRRSVCSGRISKE